MSHFTTSDSPLIFLISSTTSWHPAISISDKTTLAPAPDNFKEWAFPIPFAAPVTIATFPFKSQNFDVFYLIQT